MNNLYQNDSHRCIRAALLSAALKNNASEKEGVKKILIGATDRRRANRAIDSLLNQFHGRRTIFDLLPAMKQKSFPLYVIRVAIERVRKSLEKKGKNEKDERRNTVQLMELDQFEASLTEEK
jgi:hypothetical protein